MCKVLGFYYAFIQEDCMRAVIIVGFGGFLGTVLRYLLSLLPISEKTTFPVATLIINVLGAFLIGILAGLSAKKPELNAEWLSFLRVGICGGFTTFSTFALETTNLFGAGRMWAGALYILLSIALGIAAVMIGKAIVA
jgi:CrcB protein